MSEAVEIIISADDQASRKMAQVAANTEKMAASVKSSAKTTKASTEFAGALASLFGGTEIGGFASQIGGLTEKVGQFSESARGGGAAAVALKLGLAAAAAGVGYQIGSAIGNWIFQQKDLNAELAKTAELLRESGTEANRLASREFANKKELIQLLPNKDQQKRDLRDLLESTKQEIAKQEGLIASRGEPADEADKAELEFLKSKRSMLKQQAEDLQFELSGHKEMVAQLREQNAEREKSAQYLKQLEEEVAMMKLRGDELLRAQSYQKAYGEDAQKAFALLKEKATLEQKAKDDEMARVAAQQQAERDRQKAEQQARENERIAQQKAKEEAERQKRLNDPTLLSATESRLLSRGTGNTTQKILNDQLAKLDEIARGITEGNRGVVRGVKVA